MRAAGAVGEARLRRQYDAEASAAAAQVYDGAGFAGAAQAAAWTAEKHVSRGKSHQR